MFVSLQKNPLRRTFLPMTYPQRIFLAMGVPLALGVLCLPLLWRLTVYIEIGSIIKAISAVLVTHFDIVRSVGLGGCVLAHVLDGDC